MTLRVTEVLDDLLLVGIREKAPHSVHIQAVKVGGVELGIVGNQELFGNRLAELSVNHILERAEVCLLLGSEQVVEAIDKLLLRQLMNVHLEGEVYMPVAIKDLRMLCNGKHLVLCYLLHHIVPQFRMLEVEEMARIVPNETVLVNSLAIASNLAVGLNDQIVVRRGGGIAQSGNSGSNNYIHSSKI